MKIKKINQLIVTHRLEWGKWPHLTDKDFSEILKLREVKTYTRGDLTLEVTSKFFPAYLPYVELGTKPPVHPPLAINNTLVPDSKTLEYISKRLREEAKDTGVVLWEHAYQCFPKIGALIPELFKLSILYFADDCPGSSDIKTFPVAKYFDALIYMMYTYDYASGRQTAAEYQSRGLKYCKFKSSNVSTGLLQGLSTAGFELGAKLARLRRGELPIDLIFVGAMAGGSHRKTLLKTLAQAPTALNVKLYGSGMRDGVLPIDYTLGLAAPLGAYYVDSFAGVNVAVSSIWNCRTLDLWVSGILQFIHDKNNELQPFGFLAGTHYVAFDGTAEDLLAKVAAWKAQPDAAAKIVERAYHDAVTFLRENSIDEAFADVYFAHSHKLGIEQ